MTEAEEKSFLIHCIVSMVKEMPVKAQVRWLIIAEQLALLHGEQAKEQQVE